MESDVVWSRRLADELWSGIVTPLTFSLLADVMAENMARRRLQHAGLAASSRRPVFRLFRGHVYVNASLVAEVMRELPAPVISEGLLALIPQCLREDVRQNARSALSPHVFSTILNLSLRERGWMPWSRAAAFRSEAERVASDLREAADGAALSDAALVAHIRALQERLGGYLEVVSWGVIYAYVFFHLTTQLLERWAGDGADISGLLAGTAGIRTFEIHEELRSCAELVRGDLSLRAAVLSGDPSQVAERCRAGELGGLGERVRAILSRHGHRLVGRDLACPTWRERPAAVVEMVRRLVQVESPAHERAAEGDAVLREVLERIGGGLAGPARRELFRLSLHWCREYYAVRENMRYHADQFLALLRSAALEAGRRLSARGSLARADDVFYLTADELLQALAPGGAASPDGELAQRASERRLDYEALPPEPPPEVLRGDEAQPGWIGARGASRSLHGVGVSPGLVSGPARVIHGVDDLESLRQGEVIVAAATEPSWTSLLSLGAGLVLEMGGLLSHGAIVARELGIPAVVDVPAATLLLHTGDRLRVDGGTGQIDLATG